MNGCEFGEGNPDRALFDSLVSIGNSVQNERVNFGDGELIKQLLCY